MIDRFINALTMGMIEHGDFMPLRDPDGNISVYDNVNILVKESAGSHILIEIINGDKYTGEEITERMIRNRGILEGVKERASYYFFEVFVFDGKLEEEKAKSITDGQYHRVEERKYIKSISVNLSDKNYTKYYDGVRVDSGILKAIDEILKGREPEDIKIDDIKNLAIKKEKDFEIKFRAKNSVVTYTLIAINVIIGALLYLYSIKSGTGYNTLLIDFGAKDNSHILAGEYWRFIAPIFLHGDITHLLVNCYSLYAIGVTVEKMFGRVRFLTIYILAGILGNIASFAFSPNPGVGASGAIFGLLGTLLYFGLEKPAAFRKYFGNNVLVIVLINLAYGFSRTGIDNYAHLGGLLGGFLITGIVSQGVRKQWFVNRYLYLVLTIIITIAGLFYGFNNSMNRLISFWKS